MEKNEIEIKNYENLAKLFNEFGERKICDIADEFDGVDDRKEVLVDILAVAEAYADFLVNMTGQQEYDDCKSQQYAGAVASGFESVSYSNISHRIREVRQQVNRDQTLAESYFFDRYNEYLNEDK